MNLNKLMKVNDSSFDVQARQNEIDYIKGVVAMANEMFDMGDYNDLEGEIKAFLKEKGFKYAGDAYLAGNGRCYVWVLKENKLGDFGIMYNVEYNWHYPKVCDFSFTSNAEMWIE